MSAPCARCGRAECSAGAARAAYDVAQEQALLRADSGPVPADLTAAYEAAYSAHADADAYADCHKHPEHDWRAEALASRGRVPFTHDELELACANVGVDLTCYVCMAKFYTGDGSRCGEHTCLGGAERAYQALRDMWGASLAGDVTAQAQAEVARLRALLPTPEEHAAISDYNCWSYLNRLLEGTRGDS